MKKNYFLPFLTLGISFLATLDANAQLHIISQNLTPQDVNNSGVVVGTLGTDATYRWSVEDGLVELTKLTDDKDGTLMGRPLVTEDGNKVVIYTTNPETMLNQAAIYDYTTKKIDYLPGLEASSDASINSAWGMTKDGSAIVGLGFSDVTTAHATKWNSDLKVENIAIDQLNSSRANDISEDLKVIVGWQDDETGWRQGSVWKDGKQIIIKDKDGNPLNDANAVSDDGKYVIGFGGFYPYVWNEETGAVIIEHPYSGNFFRGGATGITQDGSTVVGYFRGWPGGAAYGEGFIWNAKDGRQNLNDYVTSLGIDTKGLILALPLDISSDGTKITGVARDNNYALYGFMLDLSAYLNTNDVNKAAEIKIYPNPVGEILNISGLSSQAKINISNTLGQNIRSAEVKDGKINVSNLSKGVYIISITENGKNSTHKFIKK